ncbi:MAG: hypothetical protein FJX75_15030 [Armatimonadetes bacterium]|nr:hypothetical protein [Armatimonadota bacterium]
MGLGMRDTHPKAEAVLIRLLREMPPAKKLRQISALTYAARAFALDGLRRRYPTASPDELHKRLAARALGPEIALRVYGWDVRKEGY